MQSPLNENHRRDIDAAIRRLHDLYPFLDKCESAGMDMSNERSDCQALHGQLNKIKEVFFGVGEKQSY